MTEFYICHNKNHVTAEKECVLTPYGDVNLYDGSCHPSPLDLVGLEEHILPVLWVCTKEGHGHRSCATQAQSAAGRKLFDANSTHTWVRFYAQDEWVLVRGRVRASAFGEYRNNVPMVIGGSYAAVSRDSIVSLTDKPHPNEPDRKKVLRSHEDGRFLAFKDGAWRYIDGVPAPAMDWPEAWTKLGPFDTFMPEGEIK